MRDHVDIDVEQFLAEAAEGRRMLAGGRPRQGPRRSSPTPRLATSASSAPTTRTPTGRPGCAPLAKHTFVDTCFELARLADADREYSEAIRYWLRILDVDPYDEDAHLGLISSLLAQRRHGEARRAYRQYSAKMVELDLEPAPFPT